MLLLNGEEEVSGYMRAVGLQIKQHTNHINKHTTTTSTTATTSTFYMREGRGGVGWGQ